MAPKKVDPIIDPSPMPRGISIEESVSPAPMIAVAGPADADGRRKVGPITLANDAVYTGDLLDGLKDGYG